MLLRGPLSSALLRIQGREIREGFLEEEGLMGSSRPQWMNTSIFFT